MGRKSKYRKDISDIISQYPNGVKADKIIDKMLCSRPTVYYNLSKLIEEKIIEERNNKYYSIIQENKQYIELPYSIKNFEDSDPLITMEVYKILFEKEKSSIYNEEEQWRIAKKYSQKLHNLVSLDILLTDSIKIHYQGKKPYYISNKLHSIIIKQIKQIIRNFILSPEVFLNINSISDLDFTFTFSFGKNLDQEISKYKDFNFSDFKEIISNILFGTDRDNLYFLKNIAKLQNIERNEKNFYVKEELSKIEDKIDSYDTFDDDYKGRKKDILKTQYKILLENYPLLEMDNLEKVKKDLQIATQKYLKGIDQINKILKSGKKIEVIEKNVHKRLFGNILDIENYFRKKKEKK
ncbi:hypothetical protein ES702_03447 [subsurface metagenome]